MGKGIDKNIYRRFCMKDKENILELNKKTEEKNKILLELEIVISIIAIISFLTLILIATTITMALQLKIILIIIACIILIIGGGYSLKIEQIAGYYKCNRCHHKYVPTYMSVFFAMHIGRTRYMKCPKCMKKSWNKKVITK